MAANTVPIYSKLPQVEWNTTTITAANTAMDGTGTVHTIFTAGVDGGRVEKVRIRARGTNVATVMRLFINNGGANSTAANNTLYEEITLAATTASATAALANNEFVLNLPLPPGYKLNVTIGTAVAAGFSVTAVGGTY